jgi:hypothetical protein
LEIIFSARRLPNHERRGIIEAAFPKGKCEDICTKMDFLVRDRTVLGKIMPFPATEDPLLFKSLQLEKRKYSVKE